MIEAFLTGLATKVWETTQSVHNNFYLDIDGRWWAGQAEQEETFPYATVNIITSEPFYTFTDNNERIVFQVNLYSDSISDAEIHDMIADWVTLIEPAAGNDWTALTISSYTVISLIRNSMEVFLDEDGIWNCVMQYTLEMQD